MIVDTSYSNRYMPLITQHTSDIAMYFCLIFRWDKTSSVFDGKDYMKIYSII